MSESDQDRQDRKAAVEAALELRDTLWPLLAGKPPAVQGAALADLLATWLAGHVSEDPALTDKLRAVLLAEHIATVKKLIPINEPEPTIPTVIFDEDGAHEVGNLSMSELDDIIKKVMGE